MAGKLVCAAGDRDANLEAGGSCSREPLAQSIRGCAVLRTPRMSGWSEGAGRLLVASLLASVVLVSCGGSGSSVDFWVADEGAPAPASVEAAERFVTKVAAAAESAATSGQFTLTITDEEATSVLKYYPVVLQQGDGLLAGDLTQLDHAWELEGLDPDGWRGLTHWLDRLPALRDRGSFLDLTVEDPAVVFRDDGQMIVRGRARWLFAGLPFRVVVAPRVWQGEVVLDFVQGQVGSLPVPQVAFDYLSRGLARALLAGQEYAEITEIQVSEGALAVSGRRER